MCFCSWKEWTVKMSRFNIFQDISSEDDDGELDKEGKCNNYARATYWYWLIDIQVCAQRAAQTRIIRM